MCLEERRLSWREVCWLVLGCDGLHVIGVPHGLRLTKYFLQALDGLEGGFMERCWHFFLQCCREIVECLNDGVVWSG